MADLPLSLTKEAVEHLDHHLLLRARKPSAWSRSSASGDNVDLSALVAFESRARHKRGMRSVVAVLTLLSSMPALGQPLFVEATERLGDPQPCAAENEGCYVHSVALADLDGDSDLDIVMAAGGGYFTSAGTDPLLVYENDGAGNLLLVSATAVSGFEGRVRQVAIGDIDGDGLPDLVAPAGYGLLPDAVFRNVTPAGGGLLFIEEGASRLGTSSRAGAARLGDVDGDGDLDLVLSDWGPSPPSSPGTARWFENDGAGFFAEVDSAIPSDTATIGTGPVDLDLFDKDGDLDLDLLLASRSGESLLFENDGTGLFDSVQDDLPDQPGPYVYGPGVCDVDGDGDLDLWLDNGAAGLAEQLLLNDGAGVFADVTAGSVSGDPGDDDNRVLCADLDSDGDLDAVVASLSGVERGMFNDGAGGFTVDDTVFPAVSDATLGLDLGDLDGDGRLDAVSGQGEYGSYLNRVYLGTAAQPVDDEPPSVRQLERFEDPVAPGNVVVRFAVVDRVTSNTGPRLAEAHLEVEGGGQRFPARFVGGDLFRAEVGIAAGATLVMRACAADPSENVGCSTETVTLVGALDPDAGVTDAGGPDAGGPDTGGPDAGGPDAGGSGELDGGAAGDSDGGSPGDGDGDVAPEPDPDAPPTCRCASASSAPTGAVALALLLFFAVGAGRRRATRSAATRRCAPPFKEGAPSPPREAAAPDDAWRAARPRSAPGCT